MPRNKLLTGILARIGSPRRPASSDVPEVASDAKPRLNAGPHLLVALMEAVLQDDGIDVRWVDSLPLQNALGRSRLGEIELLARLRPPCAFEVLVHEYAHEVLHHRDGSFPDAELREFEAHAVANEVTRRVGLEPLASRLTPEEHRLLMQLPPNDRIHELAERILSELHERIEELKEFDADEEMER